MLRSLAARHLSARQKSNIRHIAYRLGGYVPAAGRGLGGRRGGAGRRADLFTDRANDGYRSDPLNLAIFRHKLTGTFVEPQANYFRELSTRLVIYETESMAEADAADLAQ